MIVGSGQFKCRVKIHSAPVMRDEGCPNVYHGEDRVQTAIAAKVYWRELEPVSNFRGDRRVAPAARTVVQRRHHPRFRGALQTALHGLLALSGHSQVRTGLRAGGRWIRTRGPP
jgi:hypothetical protein